MPPGRRRSQDAGWTLDSQAATLKNNLHQSAVSADRKQPLPPGRRRSQDAGWTLDSQAATLKNNLRYLRYLRIENNHCRRDGGAHRMQAGPWTARPPLSKIICVNLRHLRRPADPRRPMGQSLTASWPPIAFIRC